MTPFEVATILEDYARDVERLPGVSRTRPHAFAEAKSELTHRMRVRAKELRTVPAAPKPVATLRVGSVDVGRRGVRVEVRGARRRSSCSAG